MAEPSTPIGSGLVVTGAFDYSGYEAYVADEFRRAAAHIRARGEAQNAAIVEIGATLLRVKEKVGHGKWGAWLKTEFDLSISAAEQYLNVARQLGDKIVTVTNLQDIAVPAGGEVDAERDDGSDHC